MPRRIVTALLAAALLVIALVPVVNASNGGKHKRDRDCGERSKGSGHHKRGLDVVGLTDDGRLICFSEKDPRDAARTSTARSAAAPPFGYRASLP